ncbi:electron transfer flavoprotein subunit alpha/FixB family protein [Desulforhopalus singaporensis]|uniref:Electron transfer flavoprotein alpha subunit apoprotein n=1 Tax=Desulforhopalus singaporensis TaxID=91360 RepID=A0A1H0Q4U6_9BACT|nr:electron transfer flavoprotein subunit alpha/FixB family protein [Desulforhopalus singaporensis]SDP12412.1 electron transfer flavoprotein alpha subunit apoprotein [Desulforhopalus singaporensis]
MKTLLVAEYRQDTLQENYTELIAFAKRFGPEMAMFLVGNGSGELPRFQGPLYLAEASECGEYNPGLHKRLLQDVVKKQQPDMIVFCHSSYGWDLAPRLAVGLKAAQISEVVAEQDGKLTVPACNSKLSRTVEITDKPVVVTLQAGAFPLGSDPDGTPEIIAVSAEYTGNSRLTGYEAAERTGVDLTRSEVIVSAGRGIGKPENVPIIAELARALGGEYGASRPVVDSEWVEHNRQVGTTGLTVSPKLYVACGISGAVQHLAGMKKSEFVVAINTDRDAPIGEVADVFAVADLKQLVPVLTEKIQAR